MQLPECCSALIGLLPRESLPILPSLIIGLIVAASVLIWLVQKDTKEPWLLVISLFFHHLFNYLPDRTEEVNKKKQKELLDKVSLRWKDFKEKKYSVRLVHSVRAYMTGNISKVIAQDSKQKSLVFHLKDLSSHPWWNEFNEFEAEQVLLKEKFSEIKAEFDKVFANFQRGVCKQWVKVDLAAGYSCVYPLISDGVINTLNCSVCPATFQVLSECRTLGLSGCALGSANFVLLYPDTNISATAGDTNVRLHCDLVLQSSTAGHQEVGGRQERWKPGQVLLYDDTFSTGCQLESSKNKTVLATPLVLLRLHLWHPGVDMVERRSMSHLFSS